MHKKVIFMNYFSEQYIRGYFKKKRLVDVSSAERFYYRIAELENNLKIEGEKIMCHIRTTSC